MLLRKTKKYWSNLSVKTIIVWCSSRRWSLRTAKPRINVRKQLPCFGLWIQGKSWLNLDGSCKPNTKKFSKIKKKSQTFSPSKPLNLRSKSTSEMLRY